KPLADDLTPAAAVTSEVCMLDRDELKTKIRAAIKEALDREPSGKLSGKDQQTGAMAILREWKIGSLHGGLQAAVKKISKEEFGLKEGYRRERGEKRKRKPS